MFVLFIVFLPIIVYFVLVAKMGKPCRNIRAQWTTEDLQNAIAATTNGSSVAEAARRFNIPRRTLRDWIRRGNANEPVRKLGRNPVFTTEIENQLKFRIVRFQQVGFGVTKQFICEKGAEISEALKVKNHHSVGDESEIDDITIESQSVSPHCA